MSHASSQRQHIHERVHQTLTVDTEGSVSCDSHVSEKFLWINTSLPAQRPLRAFGATSGHVDPDASPILVSPPEQLGCSSTCSVHTRIFVSASAMSPFSFENKQLGAGVAAQHGNRLAERSELMRQGREVRFNENEYRIEGSFFMVCILSQALTLTNYQHEVEQQMPVPTRFASSTGK